MEYDAQQKVSNLRTFVGDRLWAFKHRTRMWGSNEAVELQALQLLEIELLTVNPTLLKDDPRVVVTAYNEALRSDKPLHQQDWRDPNLADFADELYQVCQEVRKKLGLLE